MNFEDVFLILNNAVLSKEGRSLTKAEKFILTGAWTDVTYETIAEQSQEYSVNYLKRDVGPKLWKLLTGVFDLEISKKNFRDALQQIVSKKHLQGTIVPFPSLNPDLLSTRSLAPNDLAPSAIVNAQKLPIPSRYDLSEAVDVDLFFGREPELSYFEQWLIDPNTRCRIVSLLGVAGIGKTSFAVKLVKKVQHHFDFVIWRSIKHTPSLSALLSDLIYFFSSHSSEPSHDTETSIAQLMGYLRQYQCLLVLDSTEAILQPKRSAGRYRKGFEQYGELIKYIGEEAHQSCLLLVGREKLNEVALMEGNKLFVKSRSLSGLDEKDAQKIIHVKGFHIFDEGFGEAKQGKLTASSDNDSIPPEHIQAWNKLIEHYDGNPLAIKLAATAVYELFNGDIISFLCQGRSFSESIDDLCQSKTLFDNIYDLIEEQIDRLPDDERTLINWLALNHAPISFVELQNDILSPEVKRKFLGLLKSLKDRSLISVKAYEFTLQPVIREFLIEKLIETILNNLIDVQKTLATAEPEINHYALVKATAQDDVIERQILAIVQPVIDRLLAYFGSREAVEQQLKLILSALRKTPAFKVGYAAGNLINLLRRLKDDKSNTANYGLHTFVGYNLADLDLRQASFQNVSLRSVNLSNADLSTTIFTETFSDLFTVCCDASGTFFAAGDIEGRIHIWQFVPHSKQIVKYQSWQGHGSCIRTLAFNPKNQNLISGGDDRTIKLWDIHTAECLRTLSSKDWVRSAQFSPDGTLFAIASDDSMQLWSAALDGQPVTPTDDSHLDRIRTIAFSPNGQFLASSGDDSVIILWQLTHQHSMQQLCRLEGHRARVRSLAFSPDSQQLASCSDDQTVLLWNLANFASEQVSFQQKYAQHRDRVRAVAFSPDGELLVSGGDDGTIWIYDRQKQPFQLEATTKHVGRVQSLSFKPNSRTLISAHDNQTLNVWDLNRNTTLKKLRGSTSGLQVLDFADEHTLICGCDDHRIQVWNLQDQHCHRFLTGHSGRITTLALGRTLSRRIVIASGSDDCSVKLWDLSSGQCLHTFSNLNHWVRSVTFSPTGKWLAVAGDDQLIHLWETSQPTGGAKTLKDHKHWIRSIAFSPNSDEILASGGDDQITRLWNITTGSTVQEFEKREHRIQVVAFSPDGTILASGSDDATIQLSDVASGKTIAVLQPSVSEIDSKCGIKSIAFSPDGTLLVSGNEGGIVRLWHLPSQNCQILVDPALTNAMVLDPAFAVRSHKLGVQSVAFSPTGQTIASSSRDGEIKLWHGSTGEHQTTLIAERLYSGMDITEARGLSNVQRAMLLELGAIDRTQSTKSKI
jgi:WD40 repeat protein